MDKFIHLAGSFRFFLPLLLNEKLSATTSNLRATNERQELTLRINSHIKIKFPLFSTHEKPKKSQRQWTRKNSFSGLVYDAMADKTKIFSFFSSL